MVDDTDSGWHCIITENFNVGTGKSQYTQFRAHAAAQGDAPRELVFRFSEVDRLAKALKSFPDLNDMAMPRLPPKVTYKSISKGRFDTEFLQQRQGLMQEFFDELAKKLNTKYGEVGDVLTLCSPLGEFVTKSSAASAAEERAAIDAVGAAMRIEEDREIIATQEEEYEESLRMDELRRVAEMEAADQEKKEKQEIADREERERLDAIQKAEAVAAEAEALAKDIVRRRAIFEEAHPLPEAGEPQAMVKLRAPSGSTIQRKFVDSALVSVLFEFAAVADWGASTMPRAFDLKTSFPARSLSGLEKQTLREAELCPSTMLLVISEDD